MNNSKDSSKAIQKDQNELRIRELALRHTRVCEQLLRASRYPFGTLRDYPYLIVPKLRDNPAEITIRVWWAEEDFSWASLPPDVREKIEALEDQMSKISQAILSMEIPESDKNNTPSEFKLPTDVSGGNK